jgi:hypothetical protein
MSMAISSLREGDFIGDFQLLFSVEHKYEARANVFVETVVLTVSGLMDVLQDDDFRDIQKECRATGHFRGSQDVGVVATKESYESRMAKYNKLHENMAKKNNKMMDMMAEVEEQNHPGIIMPYNSFHIYWDLLLLVGTMYQCLMMPMRIDRDVFKYYKNGLEIPFDPTLAIDYFFDLVFIVDIFLNARVFAYNDISSGRAEIVTEKSLITSNYIQSSRFRLNLVASLPVDIFGFAASGSWSYLRVLKAVRFLSVTDLIKDFSSHMTDVCVRERGRSERKEELELPTIGASPPLSPPCSYPSLSLSLSRARAGTTRSCPTVLGRPSRWRSGPSSWPSGRA